MQKEIEISKVISAAAAEKVKKRSFFIRHLYMRPSNKAIKDGLINWVLDDDCVPPNWSGDFIPSGVTFPASPINGDYFIRTDYEPETLFSRQDGCWRIVQNLWRVEWVPAGRILDSYLRNSNITVINDGDGSSFSERQSLADIILPRAETLPGIIKNGDPTGKNR